MGIMQDTLRLPLVNVSAATQTQIQDYLKSI